ncbi:hypothetical protein SAMN05216579_0502 [Pseudomonas granadensis]|nr:hypothetical protein SAMN05216579_0502 [Pseudomonas granadensis]
MGRSKPEHDSVLLVGVAFAFSSVSSLSLRERARVRVLLIFKIRVRRGIALRGASLKHQIWLRQTVAALLRPDQSLRSAFRCRWWIKIKSTRAGAHCNEWLEAPHGLRFSVDSPLTPALSRGRGSRFVGRSKPEHDSVLHVGVAFAFSSVSSLSLRERARVRVLLIFKIRVRRGIALRGASLKHQIWLRQTVAALPRPDQSLRSAFRCRWWIKIKSTRAGAHC